MTKLVEVPTPSRSNLNNVVWVSLVLAALVIPLGTAHWYLVCPMPVCASWRYGYSFRFILSRSLIYMFAFRRFILVTTAPLRGLTLLRHQERS